MLWHFYGLQGSGKSTGAVMLAHDFKRKKHYATYSNFKIVFGQPLSIKRLFNYEYNQCTIIVDEAYGVADAHKTSGANDAISEVILQSRKKEVEGIFITQLRGDLYKRVRESAHRKVKCRNIGTEEHPTLIYIVRDGDDNIIDGRKFDEKQLLKSGIFNMFDTNEKIMAMHLNPELKFKDVKDIYKDAPNQLTFCAMLNDENKFITKDIAKSVFALMKAEKYNRVKELLKLHD